jgi:hypothetical protein
MTRTEVLGRYPRVVAHVIAESLGYATPDLAAKIVADSMEGQPNYCEWIASCFGGDPRGAVKDAIRHRHHHHGYMASYPQALLLVRQSTETGEQPHFASWF